VAVGQLLERIGATISTPQQHLGHTTASYVQMLRADENSYVEDLISVLGGVDMR
jgi:hypothetical protein